MPSQPHLIVTGGSRGIGAATARLAGARGWAVTVNYARDAGAAAKVVEAIEAAGGRAQAVVGDVADAAAVTRLFDRAEAGLGEVTGLFNNAGVTGPAGPLAEAEPETLARVLAVNTLGVMLCAREAARRMSTGAVIVNMSSMAAVIGGAGEYTWYAASKGAVDTFTTGLARELAGRGIRVNAVTPGLIDTEIHASSGRPGRLETLVGTVPMQRVGAAEEVAEAVLWLMSDAASYSAGANISVAGGR